MTEADPPRHPHRSGSHKLHGHRQRGIWSKAAKNGAVTLLREKVGDRVQSHSTRQRGRIYVVLELGTVRGHVFQPGPSHPADTPGAKLGGLDESRDYVALPLECIHMDGKVRRQGWSLVTGQELRVPAPGMKLQKDHSR